MSRLQYQVAETSRLNELATVPELPAAFCWIRREAQRGQLHEPATVSSLSEARARFKGSWIARHAHIPEGPQQLSGQTDLAKCGRRIDGGTAACVHRIFPAS